MSFVFWAALLVSGLIVGPIVAHLLQRGRAEEREFPATSLVPPQRSTARQRNRLEDWTLLVLRSLLVLALAILGAAPLVRCDRLSLTRASGASVALALVVDDSLSMRFSAGSRPRFERALRGAEDLLKSVREGDSIAIVLGGRPARVALAPTTDIGAARRAVKDLVPSDRSTDLGEAVMLARSLLKGLPQRDQRVVVLSDLAAPPLPEGTPAVTAPLAELSEPAPDCGIAEAERQGSRVRVSVACSSEDAARSREITVVAASTSERTGRDGDGGGSVTRGETLARAALLPRSGEQAVVLEVGGVKATLEARLGGEDSCDHDDMAPVSEESTTRRLAVVADARTAAAKTGGPTVIEQAASSLQVGWKVLPVPMTPEDPKGLTGFGALVLDDPRGLSPEARATVTRFIETGGVAVAFLGPRSTTASLSENLEPFARGAARWEPAANLSVDASSVGFLGPEADSLGNIGRKGRLRLGGMEIEGARVAGRWSDGAPWILERSIGRGVCLTLGLPVSPEESDLALRPAFLALIEHVLHQADLRTGTRTSVAGTAWTFPLVTRVEIEGPGGPVLVTTERNDECGATDVSCAETIPRAVGAVRGLYDVKLDGQTETRVSTLDPAEILAVPRPRTDRAEARSGGTATWAAASREVAWALIGLFVLELVVRLSRRFGARSRAVAR